MSGAEAIVLVFHNRNDSGPAFRCWNPNVASSRCSLLAILVQVLTRLAHVARIAIAARSRLIASVMGKRAGQALDSKRPAAQMCSQPRRCVAYRDESKMHKRWNQLEEDCRLSLEAQQFEVQQEGRRSRSALGVFGSSFAGASSLSAAPACGQEAERTTTVPGYASASINAAVTTTNIAAQGLAGGGNAAAAAVAELSSLNLGQLRARATSLGVAHRDGSKMHKRRHQLEEDCRIALEAQQFEVQSVGALFATFLQELFSREHHI